MEKAKLGNISYGEQYINTRRNAIRKELIKTSKNIDSGVIDTISDEDLKILFYLYDKYFFENYFINNFKGTINFALSRRMSKSAGSTTALKSNWAMPEEKEKYEIKIGVNFLFQYYELSREKTVAGIKTEDSLHALLITFEHELIHLIEFYLFGNSSCKKRRFKTMAENFFGHKGVYHSLITKSEILSSNYGLKIGDKVSFVHKNKIKYGYIYRINKRATIYFLDRKGIYIDSKGNRYLKAYISLELLKKE
ncbi:hypothetical protein CLHOM_01500 [Clostridium homopropionicum DSM 5847]|uniref:SprT-like family protein n=1 Tax=Clostridium homopropionicum DSM 5847 TaxID=1121318 RepID=A0A0L6ZER4_9CLOT|nr:hypothetical protein [Clostridium homopropionicum]KOA21479.1 hypothetical protein CLHOM_01500 [Clostridium homopropionicum DSM 5847]SFG08393.1 hypothetical protein SAMN04488501_10571 [Clostridium homopropionicum]